MPINNGLMENFFFRFFTNLPDIDEKMTKYNTQ